MAATETEVKKKVKVLKVKEETPTEEIDWEERSTRLREKLAAMADLRMKLWTRGGHVVKSKKECRPHGPAAEDKKGSDIGILGCGSSGDICIQDSSSSLGGVCAAVVLDEGGYGNTTVRFDQEGGVVPRRPKKFSMLKPLSGGVKSKVKNILESVKDGGATGEECDPGTNEGYLEVGDSNPCKNSGHVCVKDAASTLGGTCVDVGHENAQFFSLIPPKKKPCQFSNGTWSFKCAALNACAGFNEATIDQFVGCGSCVSC